MGGGGLRGLQMTGLTPKGPNKIDALGEAVYCRHTLTPPTTSIFVSHKKLGSLTLKA